MRVWGGSSPRAPRNPFTDPGGQRGENPQREDDHAADSCPLLILLLPQVSGSHREGRGGAGRVRILCSAHLHDRHSPSTPLNPRKDEITPNVRSALLLVSSFYVSPCVVPHPLPSTYPLAYVPCYQRYCYCYSCSSRVQSGLGNKEKETPFRCVVHAENLLTTFLLQSHSCARENHIHTHAQRERERETANTLAWKRSSVENYY